MMKKNNRNFWKLSVLIFTILYVISFGIYYLNIQNYEFLWYIVILFVLIALIYGLDRKYNFSPLLLLGTSIWGLMHMAGGSIYINGIKLYAFMIYPLFDKSIAGTDIFRYDQLAHLYFYFIAVFLLFYIIKTYLKKDINKFTLGVLVVFMAMGVGALNEIIEFMPVLFLETTGVGDYFNTMWDIVFNTLGAILGVLVLKFRKKF